MNTVIVENCKTLFIGRRGENEVTEVVFDFTEWQEQFGTGVIDLYVKRNLDVDAYPVVLSVDGTVATWLVTAADTDVVGNGKIEFVYTVNEKVAKSAVFPFFVGEDIGESSPEPPEHYQSWLEQLTELGAETQANAQAAAQSASEAAESAAQVAEDSNNAEAWAVGERNGEPVSEDDPTYNNNAKYWAENARANAPVQSVNGEDGDVVLTLDDIPNGETYVRATPEQLAQITTNAENIASVEAIADTALQPEDLTPYRTAAQQSVIDNGLNSKINGNIGSIADINAKIPFSASASNKLVDQNSFDSKLSDYRTASQQNLIDNNKQTKITANGILKGNGLGGISAAVAGMDYLPTSALAAYRSANAQDAIDNAQNQNINKNTAAINTMQPAATAADIGKALIVKTVADGKPTSYEYGEAGGGGSALTAGDGLEISNDVISNTQGIEYIVGTQTAATSKWTGVSTDETLKVGKIIAYYLPYAGTSTAATLALTMADGTTTRDISLQLKPNATVTTQFPTGSIIILVYDGSYWRVNASYDTDTNTYPTGYCVTNGSVAAKAAVCSFGYRGDTNYFPCLFRYANTATDATLAITTYAPEAAPIYVNGQRTSTTNTFSAGVILFLYYNGAYYCYNDGRFPILVDGAVTSVQEYATGLLVNYRTAAAQDTIDSGKQSKITASGILKGDGAGGVSSATAGTDYATPQQVNAKYTKPSGGIPSTDMTAAVQASLSKADTALQAVPDTYRTAADQDVIDDAQDERIADVEQTTTATTIGPVAIASFDASVAGMPLKGLKVNIEPVQDLHGYDHPWPAGGGKNLWNPDWVINGYISSASHDIISDPAAKTVYIPVNEGLTYTVSKIVTTRFRYGFASEMPASGKHCSDYGQQDSAESITVVAPTGALYLCVYVCASDSNNTVLPSVQIEVGSTATAYSPYSNICPITGWTGCKVHRTGISLIGGDAFLGSAFTKTDSGYELTYGGSGVSQRGSAYADIAGLPAGHYTLQFINYTCPDGCTVTFRFRSPGGSWTTFTIIGGSAFGRRSFAMPANTAQIQFYFSPNTASVGDKLTVDDVVLMREEDAETPEPYKGNTYNITFPSEAGTVYGGTLDVVNKKLTITFSGRHASELTWTKNANLEHGFNGAGFNERLRNINAFGRTDLFCDTYKWYNANPPDGLLPTTQNGIALSKSVSSTLIYVVDDRFSTVDDFVASFATHDPLIVLPRQTAITYDVTSEQITTILGTNNIWANRGDVTVTYGAYLETVKNYADKVGDSILSAIAPLETSYTASRSYAAGSFLFVGTKFYKVTAAISSGDTITPDTNVTQTTIAEQLMALANV